MNMDGGDIIMIILYALVAIGALTCVASGTLPCRLPDDHHPPGAP